MLTLALVSRAQKRRADGPVERRIASIAHREYAERLPSLRLLWPVREYDAVDPTQLGNEATKPHKVGTAKLLRIVELAEFHPPVALVNPVHLEVGEIVVDLAIGKPGLKRHSRLDVASSAAPNTRPERK